MFIVALGGKYKLVMITGYSVKHDSLFADDESELAFCAT